MSSKQQRKRLNLNSTSRKLIVKRLNNLCKYLNREFSINYGGCCYVAYVIAKLLESDGIDFKLIVYDEYTIREKSLREFSENHYHYSISIEGRFDINDDGCKRDNSLIRNEFKARSKEMLKHYKRYEWNSCYRTRQNSFIFKILKMSYDNITKDLRKE